MKTVPSVLHLDYFHLKFLYYMKIVSLSWTIQSNLGNNLKKLLKTNYLCFPWENLKWNKTLVNFFWNLTSCLYKLNVWNLHLYNAKFTTMLLNYFLYKKPPKTKIVIGNHCLGCMNHNNSFLFSESSSQHRSSHERSGCKLSIFDWFYKVV